MCFHPAAIVKSFSTIFTGWGSQTHAQPPTWLFFFVWIMAFDVFGMGDPISSHTTTSIAKKL
jgi:hypothetical protein